MMKNNQEGFSLIELLVVCTIIGIIAALSVPLYKKAIIGTENGATFAMMKIMVQEQTNFYSQKGRYARLDELNDQYRGGFGTTVGNTIVRNKFTFEMTSSTLPPSDTDLKDGFVIKGSRTIDNLDIPFVFEVDPSGEIRQVITP